MANTIDYGYPENWINVNGANIHYIDEGEGAPIVFVHGIPTCAFLWREMINTLSNRTRCIAPDLVGMGKSDKPDIAYTIHDHIAYFDSFMETLDLTGVTLVLHGWGSVIGFDWASRHADRVKGLAFYEAHVRAAVRWDMLALPVQQLAYRVGEEEQIRQKIIDENYLIEHYLPACVMDPLPTTVMDIYRAPFTDPEHRQVLLEYICELPLGNGAGRAVKLINRYSEYLQLTPIPKLLIYAVPGFMTTMDTVMWCKKHLSNLSLYDLGDAYHLGQETETEQFCQALNEWYK